MTTIAFDRETFIDGYVLAALWADCLPPEPTDTELAEFALMEGATLEYVADADTDRLNADYGERWRDSAETGGRTDLKIRPDARDRMAADCQTFIDANHEDLVAYCEQMGPWRGFDDRGYVEDEPAEARAGHDFWLTRNGHGTGFWDRGLGELGDRLTAAAQLFSEGVAPWDCGDGTADYDDPSFAKDGPS